MKEEGEANVKNKFYRSKREGFQYELPGLSQKKPNPQGMIQTYVQCILKLNLGYRFIDLDLHEFKLEARARDCDFNLGFELRLWTLTFDVTLTSQFEPLDFN